MLVSILVIPATINAQKNMAAMAIAKSLRCSCGPKNAPTKVVPINGAATIVVGTEWNSPYEIKPQKTPHIIDVKIFAEISRSFMFLSLNSESSTLSSLSLHHERPNSRGCGRVTHHQETRDPQLACIFLLSEFVIYIL